MKTFFKWLIIILLMLALGGLVVAFLLPYADDGDEGGTTIEQPDDNDDGQTPEQPDEGDDEQPEQPDEGDDEQTPAEPVTEVNTMDIAAFAELAGGYGSGSEANTTEQITVEGFTFDAGMRAEDRSEGICINNQQAAISFELSGDINSLTIYFKGASSGGCTMYLYCGDQIVYTWPAVENGVFNTENADGQVISDLAAGEYTLVSAGSARIYLLSVTQTTNT